MKDPNLRNKAVAEFAVENSGIEGRRYNLINWAEWNQKWGVSLEVGETDRIYPFEKQEFLLREQRQFGRTPEQAEQDWR
eukprot:2856700-Lingulodinium_polyedra.AAC.1